jgi:hypothetical protein
MTRYASTIEWLLLLALTALTFGLAETGLPGETVLVPVLLATLLKGRTVIDRFMGLQKVHGIAESIARVALGGARLVAVGGRPDCLRVPHIANLNWRII